MEQSAPIIVDDDGLEQFRQGCVALRRELGLFGGRLTEEQQKIYLEAQAKLWRALYVRSETVGGAVEHR
jgi:hypothetical protein